MIDLQLLGGLAVEAPDLSPTARARRRHPLGLLAIVAASAPQPVGREKLMGFLWPESDADRASNSLRQTLYQLRRDLGDGLFLPESASGLQLDPGKVAVDLWAFRAAVERGDLHDAAAAYGGPFLDGFRVPDTPDFARWVDTERRRLEREHVGVLDELAARAEAEGRLEDAVAWRRQQAAAEPFSSRAALALLQVLVAAGDRPGALQYASTHENLVRLHLETEPDPAVKDFVASLRREGAGGRREGDDVAPRRDGASGTAPSPPAPEAEPRRTAGESRETAGESRVTAGEPDTQRGGGWLRDSGVWALVVVAVVASGALAARAWLGDRGAEAPVSAVSPEGTVRVLASAARPEAGRDPATRLMACEGPACPEGPLPRAAYVVPKHSAYAAPVAGSGWVAPVPDGTTRPGSGYECCTTARFESEFRLPPEASLGRITVSVLADNQARVAINGVEIGGHDDPEVAGNYSGPPTVFSAVFPPDPGGTNRLAITLSDGGGAVGLQYHATVTWEATGEGGVPPRE